MMWGRFTFVVFLGMLSLSAFGEIDHSGGAAARALAVPGAGNAFSLSACQAGRPPFVTPPPPVVVPVQPPVVAPVVQKPVAKPVEPPKKAEAPKPVEKPEPIPGPRPVPPKEKEPEVKPEILGEFTMDGDAELDLLNKNFNPDTNCIRLVKRADTVAVEVADSSCSAKNKPVLTIPTADQKLVFRGKTIGTWEKTGNAYRILELCTGDYAKLCEAVVEGTRLIGLLPRKP